MSTTGRIDIAVVVDHPAHGDWWTAPVNALSAAGISSARVTLPLTDSGPSTTRALHPNLVDAVLEGLHGHRVALVGVGPAAAAIVELLGSRARSMVCQVVLVDPSDPSDQPPAEAPADGIHRLPVPVFLARSHDSTTHRGGGSGREGLEGRVTLRVYPTLAHPPAVDGEFVVDLLDFLGL